MGFSGGVKLGDLDDFISLSQDCVKPLIEAASGVAAKLDTSVAETKARPAVEEVQVQKPNLIKTKESKDKKAQIGQVTLSDCLACSGCVTSAETVLLQEQSGEEFRKRAASSPLTVVTISAQAITSLALAADAQSISLQLVLQKLAGALQRLGATYVLEGSAAEAVALLEGKAEFVRRYQESQKPKSRGAGKMAQHTKDSLPLLTSHCPGWTCYAEKVVDPIIIPHLAPARPPQQIQGRLVKTCLLEAHNKRRLHRWWRSRSPLFALQCGWWLRAVTKNDEACCKHSGCKPLEPSDVYHVAVQPCFDRKLEAARPSFNLGEEVREVDTVLTTTELLDLAMHPESPPEDEEAAEQVPVPTPEETAQALQALPALPLSSEVITDLLLQDFQATRSGKVVLPSVAGNGGSGGFSEYVFREAAKDLFQMEVAEPLVFRTTQNEDMREVTLEDPKSKKVLLKFRAAYGFRNIQNIIRRTSKESNDDAGHFVEIMACPGGCLNGGGQIPEPKKKGPQKETTEATKDPAKPKRRERLGKLEAAFHGGEGTVVTPPASHPLIKELYSYMAAAGQKMGGKPGKPAAQGLSSLIGSTGVQSWLAADWKSLKVDDAGNEVLASSALKW